LAQRAINLSADIPAAALIGDSCTMSDLNRGIMKFDGADRPATVILSAVVILGSIAALVIWALKSAYVFE
jgi:hypothetical protein